MTGDQARKRLYVVIEAHGDPAAPARLGAALDGLPCAALLITPCRNGLLPEDVRPFIDQAQQRGIAALVEDDASLAIALGADGVHLPLHWDVVERCKAARGILGAERIAGADAGVSRDDAMRLGEAGADYIAFGPPSDESDLDEARAWRLDLVQWWAELFETPCVALGVETAEEAANLVRAGADFIAVRLPLTLPADEPAERLRAISAVLRDSLTTASTREAP